MRSVQLLSMLVPIRIPIPKVRRRQLRSQVSPGSGMHISNITYSRKYSRNIPHAHPVVMSDDVFDLELPGKEGVELLASGFQEK